MIRIRDWRWQSRKKTYEKIGKNIAFLTRGAGCRARMREQARTRDPYRKAHCEVAIRTERRADSLTTEYACTWRGECA